MAVVYVIFPRILWSGRVAWPFRTGFIMTSPAEHPQPHPSREWLNR